MQTASPLSKTNLLGLDKTGLKAYFDGIGETAYRAEQVLKWIHYFGVTDFGQMTNLSKVLRTKLNETAEVKTPKIIYAKKAEDGTYKWLLSLQDGNCVETVFIPEKNRGTLCISSQVGCILNCDFCSTGKQGFNRNLSTAEIISQVWIAVRTLSKSDNQHDHSITNVVFMGMGEPLLNTDNVFPAINLLLDDHAYGLSKYRVTVSTAGVIPAMKELRLANPAALAVSLHAPNDALRNEIVPLNKKYPIEELMSICREFYKDEPRRSITMEYVMLDGVNDKPEHAKQLINLLEGIKVKMNLIPFNPFPHTDYRRSNPLTIELFRDILIKAGLNTTVRRTRGDDIDAACGQLVGRVKDRTKRNERHLRKIEQKAVGENS